jgi:hypothetical protein
MKMMNKIVYFLFMAIAMVAVSCSDDSLSGDSGDGSTMSFNMKVAVPLYQTTSTRAGAADPDGDAIKSMYLLCFDENGYYLGKTKATLNANNTDLTGTISGSVPSNTCRVHFLANANVTNIDDDHYHGVSENVMIPTLYSGYGVVNYWGYKKFDTSAEMKAFLTTTSSDVALIRNQARVTAINEIKKSGSTTEFDNTYAIQGIAVCNASAFGTVALFDNTKFGGDPFTDAYTTLSGGHVTTVVSSLTDDKKVKADDPQEVESGADYNIFETENSQTTPVEVIVKINNMYHKILLQDASYEFLPIYRNHQYKIHIQGLSEAGYSTFEEAKSGAAANNPLISISDVIPTLTYGDYTLTITDGTSQVYTSAGDKLINFKFTTSKAGETLSADDLTAKWMTNAGVAENSISIASYDATTGLGTIKIHVNTPGAALQTGTLYLGINGTPIRKTITVYSITAFQFAPLYLSHNVTDASGEGVVVAFNIPENFPKSLLPLKCYIVTNRYDADPSKNNLQTVTINTKDSQNGGLNLGVDWNYAYVCNITSTGPQRFYFRTVDSGYSATTNAKNKQVFVVAKDFDNATGSFSFASNTAMTLGGGNGTYAVGGTDATYFVNQIPATNQTITVTGVPAGEKVSVYTNNFVPTGYSSKATVNGVECYTFDSAPASIAFVSNKTNYSENIWFEADGYKSGSVLVRTAATAGTITVSGTSPKYGAGVAVALTIDFPVAGHTYTIKTKNLNAKAGQDLTALGDGTGFTYTPGAAGSTTLNFTTKNLVNNETVTVSANSSDITVNSGSYVLQNTPITGTLTCATGFSSTPFAYIEDGDGNRVGVITLTKTSTTTCTYSLTLRSYYNLKLKSGVNIHTTDASGTDRKATATIEGLLGSPARTLE